MGHLVLVGGGHAHLQILKQLRRFTDRGHRVTLVSPSPFHDYSGMGPGLLSGRYRLAEIRFNIARMTTLHGGRFIEAAATGIDPEGKVLSLDNGTTIEYDVLSFNCGSQVAFPAPKNALGKSIFPVKPVANLYHARQKIIEMSRNLERPLSILIGGGGAAGTEVTGNLQVLLQRENVAGNLTLIAGDSLLDNFSTRVRNRARSLLADSPLQLLEGIRIEKLHANRADLDDGRQLGFDIAFLASGVIPALPFIDPRLGSPRQGLSVDIFLKSPTYPSIFGGGDCINFQSRPLAKVGVYAIRQSAILNHNLMATLEQGQLLEFKPQRNVLLILHLGQSRALATGYGLAWGGITAAILKYWLDRNFIRRYQEIN